MDIQKFDLWDKVPGMYEEVPHITAYTPDNKTSDGAVVIFPGGGYCGRAAHEGEGYAHFLADNGITAFVVAYRVSPHRFPCPLLDARRGVKFARYYADKYGISKDKIAVMGSSAGGHLAALCSTYFKDIETEIYADDIEKEDYIPNAQILCYPVIQLIGETVAHTGSGINLLGEYAADIGECFEPDRLVSDKTPPAFIWHTASDSGVSVMNSYLYAQSLKKSGISTEVHIFPDGGHGLGLCECRDLEGEEKRIRMHTGQWSHLMLSWIEYMGWNTPLNK